VSEHKVGKSRSLGFGVFTEFAHHRVGSVNYINVRHFRLVGIRVDWLIAECLRKASDLAAAKHATSLLPHQTDA
jgi:hypothetical protein